MARTYSEEDLQNVREGKGRIVDGVYYSNERYSQRIAQERATREGLGKQPGEFWSEYIERMKEAGFEVTRKGKINITHYRGGRVFRDKQGRIVGYEDPYLQMSYAITPTSDITTFIKRINEIRDEEYAPTVRRAIRDEEKIGETNIFQKERELKETPRSLLGLSPKAQIEQIKRAREKQEEEAKFLGPLLAEPVIGRIETALPFISDSALIEPLPKGTAKQIEEEYSQELDITPNLPIAQWAKEEKGISLTIPTADYERIYQLRKEGRKELREQEQVIQELEKEGEKIDKEKLNVDKLSNIQIDKLNVRIEKYNKKIGALKEVSSVYDVLYEKDPVSGFITEASMQAIPLLALRGVGAGALKGLRLGKTGMRIVKGLDKLPTRYKILGGTAIIGGITLSETPEEIEQLGYLRAGARALGRFIGGGGIDIPITSGVKSAITRTAKIKDYFAPKTTTTQFGGSRLAQRIRNVRMGGKEYPIVETEFRPGLRVDVTTQKQFDLKKVLRFEKPIKTKVSAKTYDPIKTSLTSIRDIEDIPTGIVTKELKYVKFPKRQQELFFGREETGKFAFKTYTPKEFTKILEEKPGKPISFGFGETITKEKDIYSKALLRDVKGRRTYGVSGFAEEEITLLKTPIKTLKARTMEGELRGVTGLRPLYGKGKDVTTLTRTRILLDSGEEIPTVTKEIKTAMKKLQKQVVVDIFKAHESKIIKPTKLSKPSTITKGILKLATITSKTIVDKPIPQEWKGVYDVQSLDVGLKPGETFGFGLAKSESQLFGERVSVGLRTGSGLKEELKEKEVTKLGLGMEMGLEEGLRLRTREKERLGVLPREKLDTKFDSKLKLRTLIPPIGPTGKTPTTFEFNKKIIIPGRPKFDLKFDWGIPKKKKKKKKKVKKRKYSPSFRGLITEKPLKSSKLTPIITGYTPRPGTRVQKKLAKKLLGF